MRNVAKGVAIVQGLGVLFALFLDSCGTPEKRRVEETRRGFVFSSARGLGEEKGVARRDPSDIIYYNGKYYVYYTKVIHSRVPKENYKLRDTSYVGTIWYAVSASGGRDWKEMGEALGRGRPGSWDSLAVFSPNIVRFQGRFYLYYTGIRPTYPGSKVFENNSKSDRTCIGVAVASSPDGPFRRLGNNPVLIPSPPSFDSRRPSPFDSFRVDDSAIIVRDYDLDGDPDIWLYYKGRNIDHGKVGPRLTRMGLAVADTPESPHVRVNGGKALLDACRETMVWPEGRGTYALAAVRKAIYFSRDGIHSWRLRRRYYGEQIPLAPGMYRPDLVSPGKSKYGPQWGLSMEKRGKAGPPFLVRWECVAGP